MRGRARRYAGRVAMAAALLALGAGHAEARVRAVDAPVQVVTVVDTAGLRPAALRLVESELLVQLNRQFQPWWHTPTLRFGSGGWKLTIVRPARFKRDQGVAAGGAHDFDIITNQPFAEVSSAGGIDGVSFAMSHELLEMFANPTNDRFIDGPRGQVLAEVCDPVENNNYLLWSHGQSTLVDDFVTPYWFGHRTGPWDQMRVTTKPFDLEYGYTYRLGADGFFYQMGSNALLAG